MAAFGPSLAEVRQLGHASSSASALVIGGGARLGVSLLDPGSPFAGPLFADAMKQAAPWSSSSALRVDAAGNVLSLAPGQIAETTIFAAAAYPAGDYTLAYDGTGKVEVAGATTLESSAGHAVLRIFPSRGGIHLRLSATAPSDPVRNIRLILPGNAATYATQPFLASAVGALRQFGVLRFEQWSHAAADTSLESWPFRASPQNATQTGASGVAPEYMIALANATGDDPWFVLPVGATDVYVTHLVQLVRANLDPRLQPMFQFAEDPLATGNATAAYATLAGLAERRSSDPSTAALSWYAARSIDALDAVALASADARTHPVRVLELPSGRSTGAFETRAAQAVLGAAAGHADAVALDSALAEGNLFGTLAAAAGRAGLAVFASNFRLQPAALADSTSARGLYGAALERWHAGGGALAIVPSDATNELLAAARDYSARHPYPHAPPAALLAPGDDTVAVASAAAPAVPFVQPTCAHYVKNPECATLPPVPVVAANSSAIANEAFASGRSGNFMFAPLPVSNPTAAAFSLADPTADLLSNDGSRPYNVIPKTTTFGTLPTEGRPVYVKCDNTDYGSGLNDGDVCKSSIIPIDGSIFWFPNTYVQEMGSDGHLILVNPYAAARGHAPGGEFDFWLAGEIDYLTATNGPRVNADGAPDDNGSCYQNAVNSCRPGPPSNVGNPEVLSVDWNGASAMHVGGAGYCAWDSDGTACSGSDAINVAMTIGSIDPVTLAYVDKYGGTTGTLPYALEMGAICALPENYGNEAQYVGYVYPANNSDGGATQGANGCRLDNAPAEGARFFINRTDSGINLLSVPNFMKVILRTMDKQHHGAFVGDSQWRQSSFAFAPVGTNGGYAPWQFALTEARIVPPNEQGVTLIPFFTGVGGRYPLTPADFVFCKSGTCK